MVGYPEVATVIAAEAKKARDVREQAENGSHTGERYILGNAKTPADISAKKEDERDLPAGRARSDSKMG